MIHAVLHIRTADSQVICLCDIDSEGKGRIHDICLNDSNMKSRKKVKMEKTNRYNTCSVWCVLCGNWKYV